MRSRFSRCTLCSVSGKVIYLQSFFLMKDKYSITKKWEFKISEMKKKTDLKYTILLSKKKQRVEANWEWEVQKMERKKNSEIKKKEEQYIRKMNNEIREFE